MGLTVATTFYLTKSTKTCIPGKNTSELSNVLGVCIPTIKYKDK